MDTSNFKEVFESPKVKELTTQVAALELEVAKLRSVMTDVIKAHGYTGGTPIEVLSTPFIHTALHELIEKVEKMTIERCAKAVWNSKPSQKAIDEIPAAYQLASLAAIRVLPIGQIKLEELL